MKDRFYKFFLTGLITILPFILTIWIITKIFNFIRYMCLFDWVSEWVGAFFTANGLGNNIIVNKFFIQTSLVSITILLLVIVGWIVSEYIGREKMKIIDNIVMKLPFSRTIYSTIKQCFRLLLDKELMAKRQVAIIEYPKKGVYHIGFVTNKIKDPVADRQLCVVFLPTTPSPATGYTVLIEEKLVKKLNISIEKTIQFVMSAGIIELNPDETN